MSTVPLSTRQRVEEALVKYGKDPKRAAEACQVSLRYAQKILAELKQTTGNNLPATPVAQYLDEIMPRNVEEMCSLRDEVIDRLKGLVAQVSDPKTLLDILDMVLKYETKIREVASPAANILDQRTQFIQNNNNFSGLIEALKEVPRENLRAFAAVPKAIPMKIEDVIEGEYKDGT